MRINSISNYGYSPKINSVNKKVTNVSLVNNNVNFGFFASQEVKDKFISAYRDNIHDEFLKRDLDRQTKDVSDADWVMVYENQEGKLTAAFNNILLAKKTADKDAPLERSHLMFYQDDKIGDFNDLFTLTYFFTVIDYMCDILNGKKTEDVVGMFTPMDPDLLYETGYERADEFKHLTPSQKWENNSGLFASERAKERFLNFYKKEEFYLVDNKEEGRKLLNRMARCEWIKIYEDFEGKLTAAIDNVWLAKHSNSKTGPIENSYKLFYHPEGIGDLENCADMHYFLKIVKHIFKVLDGETTEDVYEKFRPMTKEEKEEKERQERQKYYEQVGFFDVDLSPEVRELLYACGVDIAFLL